MRWGVIRPDICSVRQIFLGFGWSGFSFAGAGPAISKPAEMAASTLNLRIFPPVPVNVRMSETDAKVNRAKQLAPIRAISAARLADGRQGNKGVAQASERR